MLILWLSARIAWTKHVRPVLAPMIVFNATLSYSSPQYAQTILLSYYNFCRSQVRDLLQPAGDVRSSRDTRRGTICAPYRRTQPQLSTSMLRVIARQRRFALCESARRNDIVIAGRPKPDFTTPDRLGFINPTRQRPISKLCFASSIILPANLGICYPHQPFHLEPFSRKPTARLRHQPSLRRHTPPQSHRGLQHRP